MTEPRNDLDAVTGHWLQQCPAHDAGLPAGCRCAEGDCRAVMADLVAEVKHLRGLVDGAERTKDAVADTVAALKADFAAEAIKLRFDLSAATKQAVAASDRADRVVAERDEARAEVVELREALAAALGDDAVEQGYASGRDDARDLVQAHVDRAEAEEWASPILDALRAVVDDLDSDRTAEGIGRWLNLVWKQAIEDRNTAWGALDSLGIDPRHPDIGARRVLAERDAMRPVVEAAKAYVVRLVASTSTAGNTWANGSAAALVAAVDQMAADTGLSTSQDVEPGEVNGKGAANTSGLAERAAKRVHDLVLGVLREELR